MMEAIVADYEKGKPLYVCDVRERLSSSGCSMEYRLLLGDGKTVKPGLVPLPGDPVDGESGRTVLFAYIQAELYNLLTTLGGCKLSLYLNDATAPFRGVVTDVVKSFGVDLPRAERKGVGRILNVAERMLDALGTAVDSHGGRARFVIQVHDGAPPASTDEVRFRATPNGVFDRVTKSLDGRVCCGLDVGGTDIKAALVVDGQLVALKEHDWNPALFTDVELLIDPIVDTVLLLNAMAVLSTRHGTGDEVEQLLSQAREALGKEVSPEALHEAAEGLDQALGGERVLDGIGLSFPDVVVDNKIVGGEVPKTLGMRSNKSRDFESQFAELTSLDSRLLGLCKPGASIVIMNDGPMAAFTAAVEMAAGPNPEQVSEGVFAHTLGTDLGTGFVRADGTIPAIPLEVYNMILDIGLKPARGLPAQDVRSLRNTNTDVVGTMQRFTSQTGAFRLAQRYFSEGAPHLLAAAVEHGFIREVADGSEVLTVVPETPHDMRKGYLAHLMNLTATEASAQEIFRDIGEYLALTWRETEHILRTGIKSRFIFGRLVKVSRCFELMQEGARRRSAELRLIAADGSLAHTPLMKQLDASEEYTVAQFGQAIGAVYTLGV